ncbi:Isopentenyl-diphosphate Delta-isomerase [Candidatus Trichorickettsia mobilis]|jgi:isopentenyl-diphosphate delta-isomerase|uniref:Isopentenyl-diphosphate Delta-isomerase n=1 Tax=Candidatus Trichorickettsia mobilis TaxID=1346319 RepID=A0ABZ0US33_9RICK|nr:isopentenyl-diphosphate Delta-isomerase [Candidatus Trichorickettsia mobilis]WPY00845.1 Isopentenyl-diphosphate Delta-isomerase [Candidatus Trichorickettsia mobilis]
MLNSKHVVLVNDQDEVLGTVDKLAVHDLNTPLHRGVSVFIFNSKRQLLLQRRHPSKKTWPNFWSNSFCGHPQLDETYEQAAFRHAQFELGLKLDELSLISDYRYKFMHNNIVENEICPIYFTISDQLMLPNFKEISETKWIKWTEFLHSTTTTPEIFTPWCIEEAKILQESDIFKRYFSELI